MITVQIEDLDPAACSFWTNSGYVYSVGWCGVEWCGMWCGVECMLVWSGVEWCCVWCGVVWCEVVWCGVVCMIGCNEGWH